MKSAARIRFHESSFAHNGVVYGFGRYEREADAGFGFAAGAGGCAGGPGGFGGPVGPGGAGGFGGSSGPSGSGGSGGSAFAGDASSDFASAALPRVPFVLLHGFAQSAASWDEVAHLLLSGCEGEPSARDATPDAADAGRTAAASLSFDPDCIGAVYALDFAGHGLSDHPDSEAPYGMDEACACVKAFVDWVARREGARPVLVGYSMGGRIALEALVRFGAKAQYEVPVRGAWRSLVSGIAGKRRSRSNSSELAIAGLVLESAGLGPVDEAAREALRDRNYAWAKQVRECGVEAFMDYWESLPLFESQHSLPEAKRASVWAGRLANRAESLARSFEGTGQHRQSLQSESLAALARAQEAGVPVLYVAGELDAKYAAVARLVSGVGDAAARVRAAAVDVAARASVGDTTTAATAATAADQASIQGKPQFRAKNCGSARFENAGEGKREIASDVSAGQSPDLFATSNVDAEAGQNRVEKSCKTEKNYRKLSNCSYEVLGAGHNVHLEQPEGYVRLLGAFAAAL